MKLHERGYQGRSTSSEETLISGATGGIIEVRTTALLSKRIKVPSLVAYLYQNGRFPLFENTWFQKFSGTSYQAPLLFPSLL